MELLGPMLVLLPLVMGLLSMITGSQVSRYVALGGALAELLLVLLAWKEFNPEAGLQYSYSRPWIESLGLNFSFGVDGISMVLLILTGIAVPIIIVSQLSQRQDKAATFFGLIMLMQSGLMGVFLARDAVLFYFFWELALIPVYFLAAIWGESRRIGATLKFFIYTVLGSLMMLLALLFLYLQTPGDVHSADLVAIMNAGRNLPMDTQVWVFAGLFLAFAIKMPIFPFHTWQPDTYTESPAAATMLLSGIMLKMGIYGLLRWLLPVVPMAFIAHTPLVITLCVIGIIYGSLIAIRQKDIKRLVAYSSFAHVGLMGAAVFSMSNSGISGAVIQMLAHGVNVIGLFLIVQIIQTRTGSRDIDAIAGLTQKNLSLTVFFAIIMLGSVALPLTNGFPGEFLMLAGVFEYNRLLGAVAGITIILGAVYMLRMFQKTMFGPANAHTEKMGALALNESIALFAVCFMVFWMGIFPNTFLSLAGPSIQGLVSDIQQVIQTAPAAAASVQ